MTEPTNAELAQQIAEVRQAIEEHSEVDQRAHEDAALSRADVLRKLDEQKASTDGLVEAWNALAGLVKVAKWIGRFAAWCGGIAAAVAAAWALIRMGRPNG